MEFCACKDFRYCDTVEKEGEPLLHIPGCGKVVPCDFSYMAGPDFTEHVHPATEVHIDYCVCAEHLDIAVDNVYGRDFYDCEDEAG